MNELIYAGRDVEKLCKEKFPGAIIKDASDEVHEERFKFQCETHEKEFYLFALREGFILECLCFQLALQETKADRTPKWQGIIDAVKQELSVMKGTPE